MPVLRDLSDYSILLRLLYTQEATGSSPVSPTHNSFVIRDYIFARHIKRNSIAFCMLICAIRM